MSALDQPSDEGGTPASKPAGRAKTWRKARERMDPEQAVRQGEVAARAFAVFGDRERALTFLNDDHPPLGGRPIDLAVASPSGLAAVLDWLAHQPKPVANA